MRRRAEHRNVGTLHIGWLRSHVSSAILLGVLSFIYDDDAHRAIVIHPQLKSERVLP